MGPHDHNEEPWRVRVDDVDASPCGAGVLLDDLHVLTCAHVVRDAGAEPGGSAGHVRVTSVSCKPEWTLTARVAPGSWVHRDGTQRGDVALLRLDEPAGCGIRTPLRRAPLSVGEVRAYGFPHAADARGVWVSARLVGGGGREGEWGQLNPVELPGPWIKPGFSGAGVVASEGEFKDRVVGIVVTDFVDGEERAAWMLTAATVGAYLREQIDPYMEGGPDSTLLGPAERSEDVLGNTLRLALTRELTRLLRGPWVGTVVVATGGATGAGPSWLGRLVHTAVPSARAGLSDAELSAAPSGTVLGLGAIDAAYDARGKRVEDVQDYLVDRFGLRGGDDRAVVGQLLRRRPPACLVVDGVDRAEDPQALRRRLLEPLASRAASRGLRLVLGFENRPAADLPYEVALDAEPVDVRPAPGGPGSVTAEAAEKAVDLLAAKEEAAARLAAEYRLTFTRRPRLPVAFAPTLRVRLAVARGAGPDPELAAVQACAAAVLKDTERYCSELSGLVDDLRDLRASLELYRLRAAAHFGEEDRHLGDLYASAARALQTPPVDLASAGTRVGRYRQAVNDRIAHSPADDATPDAPAGRSDRAGPSDPSDAKAPPPNAAGGGADGQAGQGNPPRDAGSVRDGEGGQP